MDKYIYPQLTISEVFESSRGVLMGRLWVLEIIPDFVLSCQNHKSKHLNLNYIYLISYKIAKKANPSRRVPLDIQIHFFIYLLLKKGFLSIIYNCSLPDSSRETPKSDRKQSSLENVPFSGLGRKSYAFVD
jgi:hypothetical protein